MDKQTFDTDGHGYGKGYASPASPLSIPVESGAPRSGAGAASTSKDGMTQPAEPQQIVDQLDLEVLPAWTVLAHKVGGGLFSGYLWTGDHLVDPTSGAILDLRYIVRICGPLIVVPT